ncbi:MAG: hypothetical protein ACYCTE_11235 [Acidimicrobiales bacterium]
MNYPGRSVGRRPLGLQVAPSLDTVNVATCAFLDRHASDSRSKRLGDACSPLLYQLIELAQIRVARLLELGDSNVRSIDVVVGAWPSYLG